MRRSLVLIGLPGAGKTVVGRRLAERLDVPFHDLDELIEQRSGRTITRIFAEDGEPAFRAAERQAMADVLNGEPSVVAAGGGWAAQPGALAEARNIGRPLIVYLWTTAETAARRVGNGEGRPLLAGNPLPTLTRLLRERDPAYRGADLTISTEGRPPAMVVEAILVGAGRSRNV